MTIPVSTELRNPSPDSTDAGKLVYIAALERRVLYYSIRDIKMRAALEIATGVPYDSTDFQSLSFNDLEEMIAQDMARGLNLPIQECRKRVSENKISANPDTV